MPKQEKKAKQPSPPRGFQTPRGMHDVLPSEQPWWDRVRRVAEHMAEFYNFHRIETPILESANLFARTVGADTDVVEKEMYVLKSRGGDVLALRPEGTAGVARAYMEHHLGRTGQIQKLYYMGPMFRHDNPQAGRFRQFTHIGFEIIGNLNDPLYDAQTILVFVRLCEELKIKNIVLKINSIGCRVCRPFYKRQLQTYYKPYEKKLCNDCARRLKINPLRLLDCKKPQCQEFKAGAPNFLDKLCVTCSTHLKSVLEYLDELKISYTIDNQLVRGLDYYSRTVFEISVDGLPDIGAIAGGGRYDYLTEYIGGKPTPAVGGSAGVERIILAMRAQEVKLPLRNTKKVYLVHVGELAKRKMLTVIEDLRKEDILVVESLGRESLKAQLKAADKEGLMLALILGQKEIFEESIIVRDLKSRLQETVPLSRMVLEIKKRWRDINGK